MRWRPHRGVPWGMPQLLGAEGAMLFGIVDANVEGEPTGESASEALTHGIGLPGLGVGAAAGAADVAGECHEG